MESKGRLVFLLISIFFIASVSGQGAPVFIDNMNLFRISENVEIGASIYTLLARDPEGGPVYYSTDADMLQVDPVTGVVTVTRPVDYESGEIVLTITMFAEDSEGLVTPAQIAVNVLDANDNPALFSGTTKFEQIPEDSPVGTTFGQLDVTDLDFVNSAISVECYSVHPNPISAASYLEACNTFELIQDSTSNKRYLGHIRLKRTLDYETRANYQIQMRTYDGLNYNVQSYEIFIGDVNDSPPVFTYAVPVTVNESIPLNSTVNYVVAVDGDRDNPNPIRYDIECTVSAGGQFFAIDRLSGVILNTQELDRENVLLSQGFIDLCVRARELYNDTNGLPVLGSTPQTTATATIRVNVRDLNDNSPSFHESEYTVNIREDIPNESSLPELIMTVTDLDSGTANSYDFILLDNIDVFEVFPGSGQGQTSASIKVINTEKIDYERGPRQYVLRVQAREVLPGQVSQLTGSTTVIVNVLDVNDNTPTFTQQEYFETIEETKGIGSLVVDVSVNDPDSGLFGVNGVVFGLVGNGAEKFRINNQTGAVTIAPCNPKPGEDTCIDYEVTQRFDLTVTATDELGNGLSRTARLRIDVRDVNDNPPVFVLSEYAGNIFEGQTVTIDPLVARADDRDTVGGPLRYRIEDTGPQSQLWQIDVNTANITAKAPIRYESTPNNQGFFDLIVIAEDDTFKTTVPVKIYVIDRNDNAPVFQPRIYVESIDESTRENFPILTVSALDADSPTSDNGRIEYGIETGAAGKFVINRETGLLSTAPDATFDYDVQQQYKMLVLARDGGNPQLTGTASVTINIRDANNKDPYFQPGTHRAEVFENVAIGTSVTFITAFDRDLGNILEFDFAEPVSAITPDGIEVDRNSYDYPNLFEVDASSGIVRTKSNLDRDRTSVITYTMLVVDVSANPRQTGTGTLIITVLEYNDQHPYFQLPVYNITIDEEQPIGAFVMTLIAQDEDDEIAQYEIYDQAGNYFAIAPTTGVLTVKNNIDYEKVQQTEFMARATDSGFPPLSNTTRVFVYIRNINDNSPIFDRGDYTATIPEHSIPGSSVITVTATDMDLEDYGVVRYKLASNENRFVIGAESGEITITADLDREKESTIALQVTAYDSPLDESVRREYTVPVYIILSDINDNSPKFSAAEYEATIIETIDIGAQVLQVFATDDDIGVNALLAFKKLSGDDNGYFDVEQISGRVVVGQNLRGKYGDYVFYVSAQDLNGDPLARNDTAKVTIHVIQATNSPPVWTIPPRDNMTVEVLESQYMGMLVYDVEAVDNDNGNSGIVDYGFYYQGNYTRRTPEFSINSVTGVIRAEILYDREAVDRYVLLLSARDRGDPSLEAIRFLTIQVLDVNDNVPKFPMQGGQTIPVFATVKENSPAGTVVTQVRAVDNDTIGEIYYNVLGEKDIFGVRRVGDKNRTGEVYLKQSLDREVQPVYNIDIHATNNISDFSVITSRRKRSTDPSIVTVIVTVEDVEDVNPRFTSFNGPDNKREYYGCISNDAPFGKSVILVAADDADSAGPAGLSYSLGGANTDNTFAIDQSTGLIYNRKLVDRVPENVFLLKATATDRGNLSTTVDVKVFKTSTNNEARIVINQKSSEVRLFIQQLIRLLQKDRDIQYVCVTLIRDHVNAAGRVDRQKTDVYVTGIYGAQNDYRMYSSGEMINIINGARAGNITSYNALYITGVGEGTDEVSLIDETPVLAVLIIIILLIIMALILLCLACYCIADNKRKKIQRKKAERLTVVSHEPVKEFSPVYDNPGFEREPMPIPVAHPTDEYAVVQKKRPPSDEIPISVIPIQAAPPVVQRYEPDEGPVPVIETTVMEDDPPMQEPYDPEPVIITEILPHPEPETVYYPDPEPITTYIPDPEPITTYIPDPEPVTTYIPDPEPQTTYIPDPEPVTTYIRDPEPVTTYTPDPEPQTTYIPLQEPEPESEPQRYVVPDPEPPHLEYIPEPSTSRIPEEPEEMMTEIKDDSPPPSPKSSPPRSRSPTPRYSPNTTPRRSPSPDDEIQTTEMM